MSKHPFCLESYLASVTAVAQLKEQLLRLPRKNLSTIELINDESWRGAIEFHQTIINEGDALPRSETGITFEAVDEAKKTGRAAGQGPRESSWGRACG